VGAKPLGFFTYEKLIDQDDINVKCEVKVFPLLVKSQAKTWPEFEQRLIQWVEPERAIALIKEQKLKNIVAAFAKRIAAAASKTSF
jgi:hypothetical protein